MWTNLTLKKVIAGVKLSVLLTCCWPLPKNATKFKVVCVRVYQYICAILALGLILSLGNTIRKHFDDPLMIAESITFMCPTSHIIFTTLGCHVNAYRLQSVTFEMEDFCEPINPHDETIIQRYIWKCLPFYGGAIVLLLASAINIITGPITLDQQFPTKAEYPFDISQQPLKSIIYMHQSFVILQIISHLSMNTYEALLLWFTSARFEILADEIRAITDINNLTECIRKHNKLIKYAEDVITIIRPCAFSTVGNSSVAIVIIGLVFITAPSLQMKIQCFGLTVNAIVVVFMYTWPAEQLIHTSCEIGQAIYETQWYKLPITFDKNLRLIMSRARKPLTVAIPCVMPALSLSYFASYLSTIFSYFTTLRTFMEDQVEK